MLSLGVRSGRTCLLLLVFAWRSWRRPWRRRRLSCPHLLCERKDTFVVECVCHNCACACVQACEPHRCFSRWLLLLSRISCLIQAVILGCLWNTKSTQFTLIEVIFFPLCKPNKDRTEPLTQSHVPVYDGVCVGVLPRSDAPSLRFVHYSRGRRICSSRNMFAHFKVCKVAFLSSLYFEII